MKNKKIKRASLINLIAGYLMMSLFISLIMLNQSSDIVAMEEEPEDVLEVVLEDISDDVVLFNGHPIDVDYEDPHEVVYIDRTVRDHDIGLNHPRGYNHIPRDTILLDDVDDNIYVDNDRTMDIIGDRNDRIHSRINSSTGNHGGSLVGRDRSVHHDNDFVRVDEDIDIGILDRRIGETEEGVDYIDNRLDQEEIGLDRENLGNLTLDNDDGELGDVFDAFTTDGFGALPDDLGGDRGQLYAYNYPSQGVGAGIGNAGVGAAAGFAGIGAGLGEAVLDGKTVPTLGGVGTSSILPSNMTPTPENDKDGDGIPAEIEANLGTNPNNPDTDGDGAKDGDELASYSNPLDSKSTPTNPGPMALPQVGGIGGLVNGTAAGVAAGLVTGTVVDKLGLGVNSGVGIGSGVGGEGHACNYDHLPKDGALHIMMHVDGSGSILNTRKQLDIMKDTLLKDALLPYYDNNEDLYNRRVTIIDGNGERTLQFFAEAAKKDNVLAVVFQDEASPAYHLPTFNKKPQDHYSKDIGKLKASLNGYSGFYRGVMFQVDRGKTFAKSFKEFVECAWRGEGYLETANLKRYYKDNNLHHIKNKDGIVFSDEYHAKSEGDPQYYMDLILDAAKRVGLNLRAQGGGLSDGKYNMKN